MIVRRVNLHFCHLFAWKSPIQTSLNSQGVGFGLMKPYKFYKYGNSKYAHDHIKSNLEKQQKSLKWCVGRGATTLDKVTLWWVFVHISSKTSNQKVVLHPFVSLHFLQSSQSPQSSPSPFCNTLQPTIKIKETSTKKKKGLWIKFKTTQIKVLK